MKTLSLLLLAAVLAHAEDLTLANGTVYKDATVAGVTAGSVRIAHVDGVVALKPADLPAAWQTRVGYDPAMAAAAAKAEAARIAAAKAETDKAAVLKAASSSVRGRVVQIIPAGVIVHCTAGFYVNNADQTAGADLPEIEGEVLLRGHPEHATLVEGQKIGVIATRNSEPFRIGGSTIASFRFVSQASDSSSIVTSGAPAASGSGDLVISRDRSGNATARELPKGVSRRQSVGGGTPR